MIDLSRWETTIRAAIRKYAADAPRHESEDLRQDVMVALLEADKKFEGLNERDTQNLVFIIARNTLSKKLRNVRRDRKFGTAVSLSDPKVHQEAERATAVEHDAWAGLLTDELIGRLGEDHQHVIRMLLFEQLPAKMVGQLLCQPRWWVYQKRREALDELKRLLRN